ncbi:hypothetical protein, partial [Vibrio jasicida]|uniref:hypothetical protein n=1 Tax=Vibrio jasicida TaxID=766224 RepID=UPI0005EEB85A
YYLIVVAITGRTIHFLCLKDGMPPADFKQKLEANQQAYDHGLILIAIVVFLSVLSLIKKSNKDRL